MSRVQWPILDLAESGSYRAIEMATNRGWNAPQPCGRAPKQAALRGARRRRSTSLPPSGALKILPEFYDAMFSAHGPQGWWPGHSRMEVIAGAILVQNTSWSNAEKAIRQLRGKGLLNIESLEAVTERALAEEIRSSGYYRQKAKKLKAFASFLRVRFDGSLAKLFAGHTSTVREELLSVNGIGPETADSILLYAGKHPVFVVDAYTRRILERHGLLQGDETYEEVRGLFESSLPADARVYNEYHALLVRVGKENCLKRGPRCAGCALQRFPAPGVENR